MKQIVYAILVLLIVGHGVPGKDAGPVSGEDPAVEQRLANLSKELRCLVCQNETLADSQAGL
ncbi:MAG TPA: cytochrome c-type biogenesis protein CcmH, partial [Pyrinomonadaceae bacterium]